MGPGIGLLKIAYFPDLIRLRFAKELNVAVADLENQGIDRLVVDLRGNIGGGLGLARLASYMCPGQIPIGYSLTPRRLRAGYRKDDLPLVPMPRNKTEVVWTLGRFLFRDKSVVLLTQGLGPQPFHNRIVLLVNEWTNSAAEMVAGFAAEHRLATMIGTNTAGNVLGAANFKVGCGYWMRLPVFGWYTPNGDCLDGKGVLPDALSSVLAGKNLTFGEWADWYLEMRSKPPFRSQKTHLMNVNAIKLLRPSFGSTHLSEITPEAIESYLKHRLKSGKRVRTGFGIKLRGKLKPMTVHQGFRVLRRMLNVAVKQKRLASNPCSAVEFSIPINHTIRKPHYMTSAEQQKIEFCAPSYLKNVIVIISEMGLRPYKELMPMKKSDVDIVNSIVHIPDSKTPSGIGDMPMTPLGEQAFKAQIAATPGTKYLFPSPKWNRLRNKNLAGEP